MLDLVGFRPMLFECASCRKKIEAEDQFFSAELGGVLCPNCGARYESSRMISMEALRFLRHFQRSNFSQVLRAEIPAAVRAEMETLLNHYLTFLLERGLNAPAFIRKVSED